MDQSITFLMFFFIFIFLCYFNEIEAFQTLLFKKCKIPLFKIFDLEMPTMTITLSSEKKDDRPKLCKYCVHYRPAVIGEQFDFTSQKGRCSKFREMSLITGEYDFMNVVDARKSFKHCGKHGRHYEEQPSDVVNSFEYDDNDEEEKRKKKSQENPM